MPRELAGQAPTTRIVYESISAGLESSGDKLPDLIPSYSGFHDTRVLTEGFPTTRMLQSMEKVKRAQREDIEPIGMCSVEKTVAPSGTRFGGDFSSS